MAEFNISGDMLNALPEAEVFRSAFGSQARAGVCVFHDSHLSNLPPTERKTLFQLELMTPHFSEYYRSSGEKPPHDADNPNPVTYLTVSEGAQFAFAVGLRSRFAERRDVQTHAADWLKAALHEWGIGSKTASGYGVFEVS